MTRILNRACLAALLSVAVIQGASATSWLRPRPDIDIATLTCGDFVDQPDYAQRAVLYWVVGKHTQRAEDMTIDIDAQELLIGSVSKACAAHPDDLLLSLLEERLDAAKSLSEERIEE